LLGAFEGDSTGEDQRIVVNDFVAMVFELGVRDAPGKLKAGKVLS
jgi:hypothetical protein